MTLRRDRSLALGFALATSLLGSLTASSALACSPAAPCRVLGSVQPARGASDVPRNIELRVSYTRGYEASSGGAAVLETDDGAVVPTTWERASRPYGTELWIGRPTTPLTASTRYRLRHPYRPCSETDAGPSSFSCQSLCASVPGDVISEFITGLGSDEQVLSAPPIGAPVLSGLDVANGEGGSCGEYARCIYSVDVPAIGPGRSLRVTDGDGGLVGYFGSPLRIGVHRSGIRFDWFVDIYQSGEQTYRVAVVDGTGNRSAATSLTIPACVTDADGGVAGPDGGVAGPDAGASAVDGSVPAAASQDDGCALSRARPSWSAPVWMALAFLATSRRRRVRAHAVREFLD
jgi:hypothetical protein